MARHNIVMTAAYNLKCKHILHIDALSYKKPDVWEKAYTAILQEADKKGLHSLAVPALGTGNGNDYLFLVCAMHRGYILQGLAGRSLF